MSRNSTVSASQAASGEICAGFAAEGAKGGVGGCFWSRKGAGCGACQTLPQHRHSPAAPAPATCPGSEMMHTVRKLGAYRAKKASLSQAHRRSLLSRVFCYQWLMKWMALLLREETGSLGLWPVLLALPQLNEHPCQPHTPAPHPLQDQRNIFLWL